MWTKTVYVVELAGQNVRCTRLVEAESEAAAVSVCLRDLRKHLQEEKPSWRDDLQLVRVEAVS